MERERPGSIGRRGDHLASRRTADGKPHFRVGHWLSALVIHSARNPRTAGRRPVQVLGLRAKRRPRLARDDRQGLISYRGDRLQIRRVIARKPPVCEHPASVREQAQEAKSRTERCACRDILLLIRTARRDSLKSSVNEGSIILTVPPHQPKMRNPLQFIAAGALAFRECRIPFDRHGSL